MDRGDVSTVTVIGTGRAGVTPVGVDVFVTLVAHDQRPDDALDTVAKRNTALIGILDELGIPEPARMTTGTTVTEEHRYDRDTDQEVAIGYRASSTLG